MIANRQKSRVHLGAALLSSALFSAISLALVIAAGSSASRAQQQRDRRVATDPTPKPSASPSNAPETSRALNPATATMDEVLDSIGS